jgi:diacylglycerol kinase family enzyme
VHHPKVEVLRSARVEVDAPVQLPIELEGEQVGTTPATFEVVPGALRVRVPSS